MVGDEVKGFSTKKAESLFAYLLLHRERPVSRSTLATMLWPDAIDARAKKNLNTTLWRVKRALTGQSELIVSAKEVGLAIHANQADVDLFAFRTLLASSEGMHGQGKLDVLTRAENLYAGEFMEGFSDDWCEEERRYARSQYVGLLKKLVEISKEARDYKGGAAYAQRVLALDPLDEDAHRDLMLFWYLSGNRTGALRQYETLRRTLQDELGVDPTAATTDLWEHIRADVSTINPTQVAELPKPTKEATDGFEPVPMLGRERPLSCLLSSLDDARGGRGRAVVVCGEAGVGKTKLVETLAAEADLRGFEVLSGKSPDLNDPPPYQLFIQALWPKLTKFEYLCRQTASSTLPNLISVLAPDASRGHLGQANGVGRLENNSIVTETLLSFLVEGNKTRSLLMILEDIHRIDRASADLLSTLVERISRNEILLVMTARGGEEWNTSDLLSRLVSQGTTRLDLESLTEEDTKKLIRAALRSKNIAPTVIQYLWQHTTGNPLFVLEFLKLLCAEEALFRDSVGQWCIKDVVLQSRMPPLPLRIQEVIRRRIDGLDSYSKELLILASFLGMDFELELFEQFAELVQKELLERLSPLVRKGLLTETATGFRFSHECIRSVAQMLPTKMVRRLLHSKAALLKERIAPWRTEDLVWHFEEVGDLEKALVYVERLGDKARLVHANNDSAKCYTHALSILDQIKPRIELGYLRRRCALLIKRLNVLEVLGERSRQLEDIESIYRIGYQLHDPQIQARALSLRATLLVRLNLPDKAIDSAIEARHLFHSFKDARGEARSLLTKGQALLSSRRYKQALRCMRSARSLFRRVGDLNEEAMTLILQGTVLTCLSRHRRAIANLDRAERQLRITENPQALAYAYVQKGVILRLLGKARSSLSVMQVGIRIFKQIGDRVGEARSLVQLALVRVALGQLRESVRDARRALALARSTRDIRAQITILNNMGEVYRSIGDFSRAKRCVLRAMDFIARSGNHENLAIYQDTMAAILLDEGNAKEALDWSKLSLSSCKSTEAGIGERAEISFRLGCAYLELGQHRRAIAQLTRSLRQQRKCKEIPLEIRILTELSRAYLLKEDYRMAIRCSRTAIGLLRKVEGDSITQKTFWSHSQSMIAIGKRGAASEALCKAHVELQAIGSKLSSRMRARFLEAIHYNRQIIDAVGNVSALSS